MSRREQPFLLRVFLNLCGPIGVALALLGFISAAFGLLFLIGSSAYVSWELYPAASRFVRRRPPLLYLSVFSGVGLVVGFCAWLLVLKIAPKPPLAARPPESPQLQISYSMDESLPIVVSPGSDFYILRFLNNKTADASHVTNPETKTYFYPKEKIRPDFIGLCRMGNQTNKIDFDISITFLVHFRNHGKNMPDIASANSEVVIAGSLKPGDYARIYFVNQSSFDVQVDIPPAAVLQVQGQTERVIARVNRLIMSPVDQVPPFLAPSWNNWD